MLCRLPPHVLLGAVAPLLRWHELRSLHRAGAAIAARLREEPREWNGALESLRRAELGLTRAEAEGVVMIQCRRWRDTVPVASSEASACARVGRRVARNCLRYGCFFSYPRKLIKKLCGTHVLSVVSLQAAKPRKNEGSLRARNCRCRRRKRRLCAHVADALVTVFLDYPGRERQRCHRPRRQRPPRNSDISTLSPVSKSHSELLSY